MRDRGADSGRRSVEPDPKANAEECGVVPHSSQPERSWPLTDPMRLVRAERAEARAQIGRSITAWRKPVAGATPSQPKIFLSPKKNKGGDDDKQKKGTPSNNAAQNKQFRDAVREIERQIGRKLQPDDEGRLHDEITGQNMGFHEIVEHGVSMFGRK